MAHNVDVAGCQLTPEILVNGQPPMDVPTGPCNAHLAPATESDSGSVLSLEKNIENRTAPRNKSQTRTVERSIRRGRFHFDVWRGIYLKTPFWMLVLFGVGFMSAVGHHIFYTTLNGDQVGNQTKQEWSLRVGTGLAYLTQIALVASVGVAYTQWLWRTLSSTDLSIECVDEAFDADTAIISLLNREFITKVRVGAFLALLCWLLQLPSLITPATLTVLPTIKSDRLTQNASSFDMYSDGQWRKFAISFTTADDKRLLFAGPRTIVSRLVTATATNGVILALDPPYANATYTVNFDGPAIKCDTANATIAQIIDNLRNEADQNHAKDVTPIATRYYAFVPVLSGARNLSSPNQGISAISSARLQAPVEGSNELWMVYSKYSEGYDALPLRDRPTEDEYKTCRLHRASYTFDLAFQEIVQDSKLIKQDILEAVAYPNQGDLQSDDLKIRHAYSAVMWAISDLIIGKMGNYDISDDTFGGRTNFSEINTQIAHTSLLGTSDLRVFFDKNRDWNVAPSPQTAQDVALAKNKRLVDLIEELTLNVTMSFMHNPLLTRNVSTEMVRSRSIITYQYSSRNLFLAYGLAVFFALFANILGAYAFWQNKASHTRTFSARVLTSRSAELVDHIDAQGSSNLATPLPKDMMDMKVRFDTASWGFKKVI